MVVITFGDRRCSTLQGDRCKSPAKIGEHKLKQACHLLREKTYQLQVKTVLQQKWLRKNSTTPPESDLVQMCHAKKKVVVAMVAVRGGGTISIKMVTITDFVLSYSMFVTLLLLADIVS